MADQHPLLPLRRFIALTINIIVIKIVMVNSYGQMEPYYYLGCYAQHNILLTEAMISKMPQTCVEICEVKHLDYAILSVDKCYCSNDIIPENKQSNELCVHRCKANKLEYCGGIEVLSYYTTKWAFDASPTNLRLLNATENSLSLSFVAKQPYKPFFANAEMPPPLLNIINYIIRANIEHTYTTSSRVYSREFTFQNDQTTIELGGLYPATDYNISVSAFCQMKYSLGQSIHCGTSCLRTTTLIGEPSPPPKQPIILSRTNSTITIQIQPMHNDNGPLSKLLIIVERIDDIVRQTLQVDSLGSWQHAFESDLPYYITAELDYVALDSNRTYTFVIGDGRNYGRYYNAPLNMNTSNIRVSLGVVSTLSGITRILYTRDLPYDDDTESFIETFQYSTFEPGHQSFIALVISCSAFAICFGLAVIAYIYLRYKTSQLRAITRNCSNSHSQEMTMQQPIIERENNGYLMEDEVTTIDSFKEQLNTILATLQPNKRLPRNVIRMNVDDIIAEGSYGEVVTGKVILPNFKSDVITNPKDNKEDGVNCQLHVLAVDDLSSTDQAKLLREFRNVIKLEEHTNILDFYGVSASTNWFYVIFEYHNVTLKRRLLDSRLTQYQQQQQQQQQQHQSSNLRMTTLSEQLILQWIYEIASAMEYLTKLKIINKMLCSHNIFVTPDAKLKLSIFGPIPFVSREGQQRVDITRWLAPEVLRYQNYSLKSVQWSFAIVAWECCTLGATPYANFNNTENLLKELQNGRRPQQPSFVFNDIYQMLLNCWSLEPEERPSFDDLCYNVRQLMTSPRHALCFDRQVHHAVPFYMPLLESQK